MKWTPFHFAAMHNENLDVIKYLIDQGCDTNLRLLDGNLPLHLACRDNPNIEVIEYILSLYDDHNEPNFRKDTPALLACEWNLEGPIKFLIGQKTLNFSG